MEMPSFNLINIHLQVNTSDISCNWLHFSSDLLGFWPRKSRLVKEEQATHERVQVESAGRVSRNH